MGKLRIQSGRDVIKILTKNGFVIVGRKGSHVRLKKKEAERIFITVVPDHDEIPIGTLKSIIRQSGLSEEEFRK